MMNPSTKSGKGFRLRGWIGGVLLGPATVLAIISTPVIAEGPWLDLAVDLLAWAAFTVGLFFRIWPMLYVGVRKLHTLVSEGPYSICRNPLYLGSFFVAVSTGLFLKSLTFAATLGLAMVVWMFVSLPAEEKELRETLGPVYDEYCKRVPRCWPRLSLFHTPEIIDVKVKGLRIELKLVLVWIWLPFFGELIAYLRVEPWWPHLFHLP